MGLNIVVLAKQVPDTRCVTDNAMREDGTIDRDAFPAIYNPEDLHALEAALTIKDRIEGTRVQVISMGPPAAVDVLKESLYRGADFAALVSDARLAGSDTLATSYVLTRAIERLATYDLVFCGRQSIDGDTAQVGPQTAEKLGINQITYVSSIEDLNVEKQQVTATRSVEGCYEIVKAKWPLLLTFTDEGYAPRPPSVKRMMMYKNAVAKPPLKGDGEGHARTDHMASDAAALQLWDLDAIGADPAWCGLEGSPTKVKTIQSTVVKSADTKMVENEESAIANMLRELASDHALG